MMKLESWQDLFKFNKELMDDDYNPKQAYVIKAKLKSADGKQEWSDTLKKGEAADNGDAKIANELKIKNNLSELDSTVGFKNDGSFTSELTYDVSKQANVNGLKLRNDCTGKFYDVDNAPLDLKFGIELKNRTTNLRLLLGLNRIVENQLTYALNRNLTVGLETGADLTNFKRLVYNFGVVYEPANNCLVGLKHESLDKDNINPGKFLFYFYHRISAINTLGSQLVYDYPKKNITGIIGATHKFSDADQLKAKLTNEGALSLVYKYRCCKLLQTSLTTSVNLKDVVSGKGPAQQYGVALDLSL